MIQELAITLNKHLKLTRESTEWKAQTLLLNLSQKYCHEQ